VCICVRVLTMMIVLLLRDALLIPGVAGDLYKHTERRGSDRLPSIVSVRRRDFRPPSSNEFAADADAVTLIQSTLARLLTVSDDDDCMRRSLTSD